ncbi:MAG: ATP-binding cassette domain-containing protein, partial [Candidatus Izimaplasma sp.]|nr:ATP-binding cassette domain-containing protein [Candidatus Izimaplasma bacterium]
TISNNGLYALIGESGSGKTTLLNIITGVIEKYKGCVFFEGENIRDIKYEDMIHYVSKVSQTYDLHEYLTVYENLTIIPFDIESKIEETLNFLNILYLRDRILNKLSEGEKQRVAIARAFVKNPDVIIADEPTAALDSRTGNEVLSLLRNLCRTKILIIATHNKATVRDYASRVIELKSGYTIKNELVTDSSKVRVDELDLIIDREINEDNKVIQQIIDIEQQVSKGNRETVLKDLGVDLSQFRTNTTDEFDIDDELKKRLIKERMRNSKLNTRIYRFLQTSDDFYGKKKYANKSFLRNIGLHLFSALIFTVFLLTIFFGLNFVTETFSGFNEKAMFIRTMNNENVLFFTSEKFEMEEKDQNLYHELEYPFVSDFAQTEVLSSDFLDDLLIDPYFRYQYEQDKIKYIYEELQARNLEDIFSVYYNNSSIILRQENDTIIFDDLVYSYQNIVTYPEPYTYVTEFMNTDLDSNLIYQFNFVYSENNEALLREHMLEGSRLPQDETEVVIPVAYLFNYGILNQEDFEDDYGNIMEIIPSNLISEAFLALDASDRMVEITRNIVTFSDSGSTYTQNYETVASEFEIVGLVNFDGDINPFLELRDDIFIVNGAGVNFSFIFSKDVEDLVNFEIVDNASIGEFSKTIQYAEISVENYDLYNVDEIVKEFDETYILDIKESISDQFEIWIQTLNDASALVSDYVQDDLAGLNHSTVFLDDVIDNEMFEGLTYQDLLDYYIAQHMLVISSKTEFEYLCVGCNFNSRTFEDLYSVAQSAYPRLKQSLEYVDMLEIYGDVSRLTYQESTNRIIYEEYGHLFNNQFYESSNDDHYNLEIVSSFEREYGSILSLVFLVVPRVIVENFPFVEKVIIMMTKLETNPGFISFMENTNLDLLVSSVSTNVIRSLVMVVLYAVVYIILVVSTILLGIVLINLYGNIYEAATRKRVKELASLRVLGTSYDDIYDMIKIENKRVALFSYLSFLGVLVVLSNLHLFTDAPIRHYYMPLLGLFFDFNLFDVFVLNFIAVGTVTIIFYFFIYRFIIKRVSIKKLGNIDTIKAIRDGDNL